MIGFLVYQRFFFYMGRAHAFLFCFLCRLIRCLLAIRYKIEITGLEDVLALKKNKKGVLFLPNHPAEVDPIMMMAILGRYFFPRGVVIEHFYEGAGLRQIMDFCRALPLPSLDAGQGKWRKKILERALEEIRDELAKGENFLIYPAGQLKRRSEERLGGASLVYDLCKNQADNSVVLIRTTGLWGSSFSTFKTGRTPPLGKALLKGAKAVLKNCIFFVPKRKVTIELSVCRDLPVFKEKQEFNRFLEAWYNKRPDPLIRVSYSMWKKNVEDSAVEEKQKEEDVAIDPLIQKEVILYLSSLSKLKVESIDMQSHLSFDLGLDSLDIASICSFLDKRYGINAPHPEKLKKVCDVCLMVVGSNKQEGFVEEQKWISDWLEKAQRKPLLFGEGELIHELFIQSCNRMDSSIACADNISGVFSYKKMKRAALILAEEFRKLPGEKIAVLLPSSVSGYLSILALLVAGKVPVMLNWTAGRQALDHAKDVGEFLVTLSSKKFLDRITLEDLGKIEDTLVFLEDKKREITFYKKIQGLIRSFYSIKKLRKQFAWNTDSTKMAVLLFTSGTESLPKAVPLSHRNIVSNQKNAMPYSGLSEKDSLYGSLPPFHSFGFSLTGLFPLLCGLKVFYAPDPTDSYQVVRDVASGKLTAICLAPSFLRSIFLAANPNQLSSLHLVVSGAEKPLPEVPLFVKEHMPQADWMEGYGITECSPIVSLQIRGTEGRGVGSILPNLEVCFIDESCQPVEMGKEGELCIRGSSVFAGYLGQASSPFIEVLGKKWYRSGDLGYLDEQGHFYITDRLKRTVKIGGEMISLSSVEHALYSIVSSKDQQGPLLAVLGKSGAKEELILFTTKLLTLEQVNHALRDKGFARIVKISQIIELKEIPLTGAGKVHYRELGQMI